MHAGLLDMFHDAADDHLVALGRRLFAALFLFRQGRPGGRPRAPTVNPSRDVFHAQLNGEIERMLESMGPARAEAVDGPLHEAVSKIRSFVIDFLDSARQEETFLQDQNQREIQRLMGEKRTLSNELQDSGKEVALLLERIDFLEGLAEEEEEKHALKVAQLEASLQASLRSPTVLNHRSRVDDSAVELNDLPHSVRAAAGFFSANKGESLDAGELSRSFGYAVKTFLCWRLSARFEKELRRERARVTRTADALRESILETQKTKLKLAKMAASMSARSIGPTAAIRS